MTPSARYVRFRCFCVAKRMASCTILTSILFTLNLPVHGQSDFDQAHALLEQLSRTQQEKRDRDNAARLAELMSFVPARVQQLLTSGIINLLNASARHSADEVHRKLTAALQVAPLDQHQPEAFVYQVQSGGTDVYLIAYNVIYCVGCSRGWLGTVGGTNGFYQVLASDDNAFPNQTLAVVKIWPTGEGNFRFLVYGTNWGDAHNRLTATVYVLDGGQLKSVWSLADLPQGSIKVTPTEITVSFLTALVPPWSEKTETYAILPGEIKLRQSIERPNP
jgi:hypothetical protein